MTSDAGVEALQRWPVDSDWRREDQNIVSRHAFELGARWQAEQDHLDESEIAKIAAQRAVRISELDAEVKRLRAATDLAYSTSMTGMDARTFVDSIEHLLDHDPVVQRAEAAEAKLAKVREQLLEPVRLGAPWAREWDKRHLRILSILDGGS